MNQKGRTFGISITVALIAAILLLIGCGQSSSDKKITRESGQVTKSGRMAYPADFAFTEVPNPLSGKNKRYSLPERPAPVVGETFKDERFGTFLTPVTQEGKIRHEYSRYDPFNSDQSMIVLQDISSGEYSLFRTGKIPYEQKVNRVRKLGLEEPRWDPEDPGRIWGFIEFAIVTADVKTGKTKVVKDFSKDAKIGPIIKKEPDLYRITMRDEGESSTDKRFWALGLQGSKDDYRLRYIFTWDRQKDEILGLYDIPKKESEIDWVGMSPKGNWVLIGADAGNGENLDGLTMADPQLTEFHKLANATAHADVGLDSDGNEVVVMQNSQTDYIDLIPIDLDTTPVPEDGNSYKNTNRIKLIRLFYGSDSSIGLNSGVHISCNYPGYCVVSTHIEPGAPERNWLDRTIVLVKLDRKHPRVFYLAKVHNTTKEYWEETHATITNDGSKIIWASNWGQNVGKERLFLMQLDMPDNWASLIK
jgi:hypothetical protein